MLNKKIKNLKELKTSLDEVAKDKIVKVTVNISNKTYKGVEKQLEREIITER